MNDREEAKRRAAAAAIDLVRPGMRLGLGTGSTAAHFVALLGARVAQGLKVVGVPTSERTRAQAHALGIPLATLDELTELDLTIDGADEFDLQLRLIKGGGGALLREKMVAAASRRMVVVADSSKAVESLGKFPLPVEVDRFGLEATRRLIAREAEVVGCIGAIELRKTPHGQAFVSEGGHYIVDCSFGSIQAPEELAERLIAIPGVVEHGLFIGLAKAVIAAGPEGVEVHGSLK
ncbi:MAG TPA: ribose-5-phosphate isomerase RpiA [Methylovirgula sp.]|nr:ribose-5-phosphate isomerase RpiA [Methylovirgula sp.]